MQIEINEDLAFVVGCILIIALALTGCYFSAKAECSAKATALGYNHNYKWFQGCLLIREDGSKVLLEQLRDFND